MNAPIIWESHQHNRSFLIGDFMCSPRAVHAHRKDLSFTIGFVIRPKGPYCITSKFDPRYWPLSIATYAYTELPNQPTLPGCPDITILHAEPLRFYDNWLIYGNSNQMMLGLSSTLFDSDGFTECQRDLWKVKARWLAGQLSREYPRAQLWVKFSDDNNPFRVRYDPDNFPDVAAAAPVEESIPPASIGNSVDTFYYYRNALLIHRTFHLTHVHSAEYKQMTLWIQPRGEKQSRTGTL